MTFYIGIPSYKRAKYQNALAYLEQLNFPRERIYLSVQCESDLQDYTTAGVVNRVGHFIYKPAKTAAANRNTLLNAFQSDERILLMDDDIQALTKLVGGKFVPVTSLSEFEAIVERGFEEAERSRTIGFGVYHSANEAFCSGGTKTRAMCTGRFLGIINSGMRFDAHIQFSDDYEFVCRAIQKYGSFLRFDDYAIKHSRNTGGGRKDARRDIGKMRREANQLVAQYPEFLVVNPQDTRSVKQKRTKS